MIRFQFLAALLLMGLGAVCTSALADAPASQPRSPSQSRPQKPVTLFPKGTCDVTLTGSFIHDWDRGNSNLAVAGVGAGYYVMDNVSLGIELDGYQVFQDESTYAGGIAFIGRHHLFTYDKWTIFADVGFGVFEASDAVPAGGTHFNFTFRTGLGATYRIADGVDLMGGVRYFHLSNARIDGGRGRNPSINGFEPYIGIMWTF
jgi:hypothetical protein